MGDSELERLVRRRWRIGATLTALEMAGYFGLLLPVAFHKESPGLGAGVIVLAPVFTSIYVRWANRTYDPQMAAFRAKRDENKGDA